MRGLARRQAPFHGAIRVLSSLNKSLVAPNNGLLLDMIRHQSKDDKASIPIERNRDETTTGFSPYIPTLFRQKTQTHFLTKNIDDNKDNT